MSSQEKPSPSYEVHIPIEDEPSDTNSRSDQTSNKRQGPPRTSGGNDDKQAVTHKQQGDEPKTYDGEEYQMLLEFVKDEVEKEKHKHDDDDVEEQEFTRLWYMPWKKIPVDNGKEKAVPAEWLDTDITKGLSDSEVESRRKDHGYNELQSPTENQFVKFVSYFRGSILYVMEIAVILSAGLQDWIDFGVIIAILLMNAAVGWYQEKSAGDIVAQLKAGIAMTALVVRNGKEQQIEARELVIGDVIILKEGKTIPADAKIVADYRNKNASATKGSKTNEAQADAKIDSEVDAKVGACTGPNVPLRPLGLTPPSQTPLDKNADPAASLDTVHESGPADKSKGHKGPSILAVDQSAITGESLAADKYAGEVRSALGVLHMLFG
ncbi:hypothetical protein HDU86_006436 [Geranomyces michiganensis]|nr:hypothetical protein HDU86_006436 [Geranomyces michiganensis]